MKKLFLKLFSGFILFFILPVSFAAAEKIQSFSSDIVLLPDSSYTVTETIQYDFESAEKHGIYRDIPVHYKRPSGDYNVRLTIQNVTDENNIAYPYTASGQGDDLRLKIGDPDTTITGEHTYIISYTVVRGINYFQNQDELYWNVTGNNWPVPIEKASAIIHLPDNVVQDTVNLACYTGSYGSTESNCDFNPTGSGITFQTKEVSPGTPHLASQEGLTIVVGLPKGILTPPPFSQEVLWFIQDNWVVFVPLLVLLFLFWRWWTRGRDPETSKHIAPMYDAPKNLTPSETGVIVDEKVDMRDIAAAVIQLAVTGYLRIKEIETKVLFFKGKDYEFTKLKEPDDKLKEFELLILEGIFDGDQTKKMSELKDKFYTSLKKIKEELYKSLTSQGYFPHNPENVRAGYAVLGIAVAVIGGIVGGSLENGAILVSFIVTGLIILFFARIMPRKSAKGVAALIHILGLKLYLNRAEKKQLDFLNAPAKKPEVFEKYLPFAMVLGVEENWAKEFADIYKEPPGWYQSSGSSTFNSLYLVHSLNTFAATSGSTFTSAPSSAGSGGSGFSGGGSGGGFGGGGGGSW